MNTFNRMLAGGIAALALVGAATATAGEVVSQAQIDAAQTSEQHEAIARTYDEEAVAVENRAESHAKMANSYRYHEKVAGSSMARHCDRLAELYRTAGREYRMLATEHRAMAAAAAK